MLRMPTGFGIVMRVPPPQAVSTRGGEILSVSAVGSVRPTVSVDGFSEANTALNSLEKPEDWNQGPRTICELRESRAGYRARAIDYSGNTMRRGPASFRE